ncbi:MAG TPA: M15 family metallopeptidase [Candidatus Kapabacteria bacterium]|nr:M15 family metallopeptidase [Candidatus Kapabacteria bacterium]
MTLARLLYFYAALTAIPSGFVDISALPTVTIDKRYATTNNCCGRILDSTKFCILRDIAYKKLEAACSILQKEHPGWKFIVFDAYRPLSVQKQLWDHVKGTPYARYVAYPLNGSLHTMGLAIDLSIIDEDGKPLDMGTGFDEFTPLAAPRNEAEYLRTKKLSQEQYQNRLILRRIMQRAGFIQLQSEWWHYEAMHQKTARARYK